MIQVCFNKADFAWLHNSSSSNNNNNKYINNKIYFWVHVSEFLMITWGWNNKARDFNRKLWHLQAHNSHQPLIIFIFTNWTVWQNKSQQRWIHHGRNRNWIRNVSAAVIVSIKEKPDPSTDLEQRSDVHIKPQVSEARGDDLGASVVTVLTHLCHQQTWVPALVLLKICYSKKKRKHRKQKSGWPEATSSWWTWRRRVWPIVGHGDLLLLPVLAAVRPAHHPGAGFVFPKHGLHGISDLTYGASGKRSRNPFRPGATTRLLLETWGVKVSNKEGDLWPGACCLHGQGQQVALPAPGTLLYGCQARLCRLGIATLPHLQQKAHQLC